MKKSLGARTLLLPTPVLVVGTYDSEGVPNLMTAAWGGLVSSLPPMLGVSVRQATHSHASIHQRKAFTVSIGTQSTMVRSDFIGLYSGRNMNKFDELNLTHIKSEKVDAPYADEFPLVLECELAGFIDLGAHTQFIGRIVDVKAENNTITLGGMLNIMSVRPILFDPAGYNYHSIGAAMGKAFHIGKNPKLKKG